MGGGRAQGKEGRGDEFVLWGYHGAHPYMRDKRFTLYDQSVVHPKTGDCHRAAIATALQIPLPELTNYATVDDWHMCCLRELMERGWMCYWHPKERAAMNESPTGWMVASVPSLKFPGKWHSVVVDADMKLVHDPNWSRRRGHVKRHAIRDVLLFVPIADEREVS
jgi:hypothetical protein